MADIDEMGNRLRFGVMTASDIAQVGSVVARLGIPSDAVLVDVEAPALPDQQIGQTLNQQVRPVLGGVQINDVDGFSSDHCTLGFNVYKTDHVQIDPTHRYFLTASHCVDPEFSMNSTLVGQPGVSPVIGTEVVDPPVFTNAQDPACPVGAQCRYGDVVLVEYNAATTWDIGWLADISSNSTRVITGRHSVIAYWGNVMNGTTVRMIAAFSGETSGTVTASCQTRFFDYDIGRVHLLCQNDATYSRQDGDSGAPIYVLIPGGVAVLGTHVGRSSQTGRSVFGTLNSIFAELNGGFGWFTPCATLC